LISFISSVRFGSICLPFLSNIGNALGFGKARWRAAVNGKPIVLFSDSQFTDTLAQLFVDLVYIALRLLARRPYPNNLPRGHGIRLANHGHGCAHRAGPVHVGNILALTLEHIPGAVIPGGDIWLEPCELDAKIIGHRFRERGELAGTGLDVETGKLHPGHCELRVEAAGKLGFQLVTNERAGGFGPVLGENAIGRAV
jgi:hypothetical protein